MAISTMDGLVAAVVAEAPLPLPDGGEAAPPLWRQPRPVIVRAAPLAGRSTLSAAGSGQARVGAALPGASTLSASASAAAAAGAALRSVSSLHLEAATQDGDPDVEIAIALLLAAAA